MQFGFIVIVMLVLTCITVVVVVYSLKVIIQQYKVDTYKTVIEREKESDT